MRLTDTAVGDAVRVLYGHLADSFTNTGQTVRCGQIVGLMGNSGKAIKGAHLHFEVRLNDRAVDPAAYLERALQAEPPEWYTEGRKQ
jgi:murein DD-endopeptidase MepM/ murein hydrolase activator NlpD